MSPTATDSEATSTTSSTMVTPDEKGVKEPAENDVLCGRGGSINSHPGNERFRTLVEKRKRVYLTARFKREKRLIASSIVSEIRGLNGRFLSRDPKTGLWQDIGDEKARDKTSQALRENAPSIRAEIETEINEQRAEMYKDESAAQYPPHAPPSYYSSWYPSYYGYGPPQPPPPPHGHPHPPPPPPGSMPYAHQAHPPPPPGSHPYAAPPPPPYDYYGGPQPDPYARAPPPMPPPPPKSAVEQTVDLMSTGAESIKNWTKTSLSFGGLGSAASTDGATTVNSKPLAYKHEDRRKMVKFRDDESKRKRNSCYSPVQSNNSLADSTVGVDDMEPQSVDAATNSSLMNQVANHILGSIGSWDAATTICGGDYAMDEKVPFPKAEPSQYTQDTDMTGVEWEGQEVQLVEDKRADDQRMPPPPPPPAHPPQGRRGSMNSGIGSSIGFSSVGSCHSWLPEQISGAASGLFGGGRGEDTGSMDMEFSAADHYSMNESAGDNNSLSQVFEYEATPSPNMSHRVLNQVPSWERSLRSRSPHSMSSHGDDDESLISKTSSKGGGALSPVQSMDHSDMAWTQQQE